MVGGAVLLVGFAGVNTLVPPPPPPAAASSSAPPDLATSHPAAAPGAASPRGVEHGAAPEAAPPDATRRSYAVGLHDLAGFPPDAAPGARLELWVTWEPPLTEEPRLQKLIGDVVLERTIPGSVPEAPVTVLLSVPAERVGDLIYADGFGRLSVALPR
jgi:hypothetical protein